MPTEQTDKKRTTLSLPHEVVDEIDEYAEETHVNTRSKAVELIAREQLEDDEPEAEEELADMDMVQVLGSPVATGLFVSLLSIGAVFGLLSFGFFEVFTPLGYLSGGFAVLILLLGGVIAALSLVVNLAKMVPERYLEADTLREAVGKITRST